MKFNSNLDDVAKMIGTSTESLKRLKMNLNLDAEVFTVKGMKGQKVVVANTKDQLFTVDRFTIIRELQY